MPRFPGMHLIEMLFPSFSMIGFGFPFQLVSCVIRLSSVSLFPSVENEIFYMIIRNMKAIILMLIK